jgi:hypothetical protein
VDLAALHATGIRVYSVGTGDTSVVDVDALKTLSETTGGEYAVTGPWNADSEQQMAKFFCQALAETAGFTSLLDPSGVVTRARGEEVVDLFVTRDEQRLEVILMKPEGTSMELALETPDGQEIDAATAKRTGGVEYRVSDRVIVLRVTLPYIGVDRAPAHAGTWRAAFRVTDGPEDREVPYTLAVNARSRLKIEAAVTQDGTGPGATADVVARLFRDGKPFAPLNLAASLTVRRPDGSEIVAKLADGRGRFTRKVSLPLEGAYRLSLRVAGEVDGKSFAREKVLTAATWTEARDPGDGKLAVRKPPGR